MDYVASRVSDLWPPVFRENNIALTIHRHNVVATVQMNVGFDIGRGKSNTDIDDRTTSSGGS